MSTEPRGPTLLEIERDATEQQAQQSPTGPVRDGQRTPGAPHRHSVQRHADPGLPPGMVDNAVRALGPGGLVGLPVRPVQCLYSPKLLAAIASADMSPPDGPGFFEPRVQRKSTSDAIPASQVHQAAAHGLSGSGGQLPHAAAIQQSFGHHDVSGVSAHVGGRAAEGAAAMGASAYATGNDIAFASSPDLHTAAHEAAHIVQQRSGVDLPGDVSSTGDRYEQHADKVADAVVRGESAAGLLDEMGGGGEGRAVQRRAVQRRVVQRQSSMSEDTDAGEPAEQVLLSLGERTVAQHPHGVPLALWQKTEEYKGKDREIFHRAVEWAKTQHALGGDGDLSSAGAVDLGLSIPVEPEQSMTSLVESVMGTLSRAIDAIEQARSETYASARQIRVLALFSHATGSSLMIGQGVNHSNAGNLIADLSPHLSKDVKLITYGCSTSKGVEEELDEFGEDGKSQREYVMSDGGEGSINDTLAGALADEGKTDAAVWGHSYRGKTTQNPALREFPASPDVSPSSLASGADAPSGADRDAPGRSFAIDERYVGRWKEEALAELRQTLDEQGYDVSSEGRRERNTVEYRGGKLIEAEYFKVYHDTMREKSLHNHASLAEAAPLYPDEVGQIVRAAWETRWADIHEDVATQVAESVGLSPHSDTP